MSLRGRTGLWRHRWPWWGGEKLASVLGVSSRPWLWFSPRDTGRVLAGSVSKGGGLHTDPWSAHPIPSPPIHPLPSQPCLPILVLSSTCSPVLPSLSPYTHPLPSRPWGSPSITGLMGQGVNCGAQSIAATGRIPWTANAELCSGAEHVGIFVLSLCAAMSPGRARQHPKVLPKDKA